MGPTSIALALRPRQAIWKAVAPILQFSTACCEIGIAIGVGSEELLEAGLAQQAIDTLARAEGLGAVREDAAKTAAQPLALAS